MNPKELILDQIISKLKEADIVNAIISFNITDDTYKVMLKNNQGSNLKLDIDKKEISLLKLIFINKIRKRFEKNNVEKMKAIHIQLDIEKNLFEIFIEDMKNVVTKFEY
jgi:sucrose-6-phosphate hydrolase SacC (GH32 family)